MFKLFKTGLARWRTLRAQKDFNRGYDFAAGALLRGDHCISSIEDMLDDASDFSSGVRAAIHALEKLGLKDWDEEGQNAV